MASMLQSKRGFAKGSYTLHRCPHAAAMREHNGRPVYGNIMHDRRVIRGNTYAPHIPPLPPLPDQAKIERQQEALRRAMARKRARDRLRSRSPPPQEGRKHVQVQTEVYLEELMDDIEGSSVQCQTDTCLDKPDTPLFIPVKSGKDASTQIELGELFDFDLEVQPVLEVLVGKTMEQALLEVLEEEELAVLRAQQRAFQELRNAELAEVQRLEEEERRRSEEKARRIEQQRLTLEKERETAEKIAARTFSQHYLADLLPSVFANLRDRGYFYDPVVKDIETGFLPRLMEEVENSLEKRQVAQTVLDTLIQDVTSHRQETFQSGSCQ